MSHLINNVSVQDLDALLALNELEVPHLGRIEIEQMHWFADNADYFRVVRRNSQIAGFLIGLLPGSDYSSPNYRWFCDHYENFCYVDRVAVTTSARGLGIASALYRDFADKVPEAVKLMTCEVNIRPPNEGSMRFHQRLGFYKLGSLSSDDGAKQVALLAKDL